MGNRGSVRGGEAKGEEKEIGAAGLPGFGRRTSNYPESWLTQRSLSRGPNPETELRTESGADDLNPSRRLMRSSAGFHVVLEPIGLAHRASIARVTYSLVKLFGRSAIGDLFRKRDSNLSIRSSGRIPEYSSEANKRSNRFSNPLTQEAL